SPRATRGTDPARLHLRLARAERDSCRARPAVQHFLGGLGIRAGAARAVHARYVAPVSLASDPTPSNVIVLGAGLAGSLMSILLARRGHRVQLFERFADMRRESIPAGRSINLALAARGIRALELAGVMPTVLPLLIPMRGRMLHAQDGALTF